MAATDRKHQLLETALDMFSRRGFEGATTKEIAAAAGVAEAVIFRHFPNKQALYTAVLDYKLQSGGFGHMLAGIQAHMEANDDEGVFRAIAKRVLDTYRTDTRFERMVLFAALEGHSLALAYLRQHSLPLVESLRSYVRRRQAAGALRGKKPGLILCAIFGLVHHYGQVTQMFGFPPEGSDKEVAEAFVHMLMDGIRPHTPKQNGKR
jgi:TetR/AcrR family transcriptional regulator